MRTGLIVPVSNDALGVAFLLAIAFLVIAGIFKIIQKATFVERESVKFADQSHTAIASTTQFQNEVDNARGDTDYSNLVLPSVQDASTFFTKLAPSVRLNIEINRTKNTLLFSNSDSTEHRLVIATTGSGRFAAAYYATGNQKLFLEPRLKFQVAEKSFEFKASAESLIFRDRGISFYEVSSAALSAMIVASATEFNISVNEFTTTLGGQETEKMKTMANLILRIVKSRSDILFLDN